MFSKILIANRGEIAVRVIKTCRRMGIRTVVVYSDADAGSMAVEMADEKVHIGPSPAAQSYLLADKIIDAVRQTGAEAIHPGFGFLSENAAFAKRLEKEGIGWIGPNAHAIDAMGDKISSKKLAAEAGVSTVPGHMDLITDTKHAVKISREIGYPVMIKASAGGGGKGIRVAANDKEVEEGFPAVKAEATASFGDDRIFIEKFILEPRHIEIQVLGDKHGNCLWLNERECSIQRRNQKVIEEAPSPLLDAETRKKMGEQAVALAKAVNYDSAGTVEFVASGKDKGFYFLEMNTRLQVEHPVTEMITGIDLVEQMLRSAYGEKLKLKQSDIKINGWAVESRVYAEDPYRNFLPSIGRLKRFHPPAEGKLGKGEVRVDSGVREGDEISMYYDPMIAKLVTWGKDRDTALDVHGEALDRFQIEGIQDNIPFIAAVMDEARFRSGNITTAYIKDEFPEGFEGVAPTRTQEAQLICSAAYVHAFFDRRARQISGRLSPVTAARKDWVVILGDKHHPVTIDIGRDGDAQITVNGGKAHSLVTSWHPGQHLVEGVLDGKPFAVKFADRTEGYIFRHRGVALRALVCTPVVADLHARLPEKPKADTSKLIISPMPGLVVSMEVALGQEVQEGEAVCIVEAMKMQNIIRAGANGTVKAINVKAGDSVAADEIMVEFA
ncbi:MAG: acetyl/propionyl/methylcrotonyl-CoA carboxylase subunit alpha [Hyphomonas sp.]|uniref:acetyl/propionyl/methylcrotonyl-CoA carboxylase subunit alpha n=1 Tax=Hyphomonas sp. TaxID=87 RepID=UPI0018153B35|nr:acetyl/propionyl/methylcrotonyl-CoA carboxylase subunit alpha [Hyphomonas sp.]MBA3067308.1 acetyl/propionyl/methylcrotonyl-CoA carboxylase subunit alpha [Hyphomonas sp.]MBU3919019.1 acetyl/propionyl/methylcrotonyl-CoA carboxylase subunit alpha [Alphaproteobacteria bacterium]MBU4062997.1 acetyl/propionyl/methylcrotonyl-CoA carboxylase subunit alpha [Alphaproteobacteria bacterium]MBU4163578.1 acetyl/propionyl/methylcrotonyl-CoA carboxylase subunit alpha [Alphaproteobacteria bacterium]